MTYHEPIRQMMTYHKPVRHVMTYHKPIRYRVIVLNLKKLEAYYLTRGSPNP
jgi:hypothetical protein